MGAAGLANPIERRTQPPSSTGTGIKTWPRYESDPGWASGRALAAAGRGSDQGSPL